MSDLLERCRAFVEEQSCGEWDDKTIMDDAKKLALFVGAEVEKLQAVKVAGTLMANAMYNLSQRGEMTDAMRQQMREMQQRWDSALASLPHPDAHSKGAM